VVVTVVAVGGGFLWSRDGASLETREKQSAIADGEAGDTTEPVADGIETATYDGGAGFPARGGADGLDGVAGSSSGTDGNRQFGQDNSSSAARIPLDDDGRGLNHRQLEAIPQNEPEPLAEPPSFDVASEGAPALFANAADDEFSSNTQRLPRNEQGPELSAQRNPGRSEGALDRPVSNSRDQTGRSGGRRLQWGPSSSSPSIERTPFAADGNAIARRDLGDGAVPGTLPRSVDGSGTAQPIVADGRSPVESGRGGARSGDPAAAVHAVASGDSYWTISQRHYGTAQYFQALAEYNRKRIPDPRLMRPGMKVLVPSRELLETRFAGLLPRVVATAGDPAQTVGFQIDANGNPVYSVGPKDTLTAIAQMHLGRRSRWIQIFRMNRDQLPSPHRLKPGTVLRMPADAARLQVAGGAGVRR
jgi:hypothetical protein